jgi:hypothetical protein
MIIAVLFGLALPSTPAGAAPTTVGYIGCSLTWQSVNGYHLDGGTRLWPAMPGYGGGEIPKWFEGITDPTPTYWPVFEQMLSTSPATTFWVQACFLTAQIKPSNISNAEAVVRHIRELVPGATIYFSAMNGWNPPGSCTNAGPTAVSAAQQVTDALVAEGLVLRGPGMPVLPADRTVDGCHPDSVGQELLGRSLLSFFDGASSAGSIFTQTPSSPSDASATFAFSVGSGLSYRCTLDAAAAFDCSSPVNLTELSDGVHSFSVRSRSTLNGQSSTASTFTWWVDATPPPTPRFVVTPSRPSGPRARFAFTDSEAAVTFKCALDRSAWASCSSPTVVTRLSNGSHTFRVRAYDEVGNRSGAKRFSWRAHTR